METSNCQSCNRKIIWTTSPSGARLPLDARSVTMYRIVEGRTPPAAEKVVTLRQPGDDLEEVKAYVSHFLTCPDALKFSRGSRPR